jgi:hypothetical protein
MGEERKSVRTKCFLPAEIIKSNGRDNLIERVSIQDFSPEGFKLVINLNLSPSSILESKIYIPEKNINTSLLGEVVWNRLTGNKFEIGLKIRDMDEDKKAEILDWIAPLHEESYI